MVAIRLKYIFFIITKMIGFLTGLVQLTDGRIMAIYGVRPGVYTKP
jgi:hypothetical protein